MSLKERRTQTASGQAEHNAGPVDPPDQKRRSGETKPSRSELRELVDAAAGDEFGFVTEEEGYDSAGNILAWTPKPINVPVYPQSMAGAAVPGETITVAANIEWSNNETEASGTRDVKITWAVNPCGTVPGDAGEDYDFGQVVSAHAIIDEQPVRVAAQFEVPDVKCSSPRQSLFITPIARVVGSSYVPSHNIEYLNSVEFKVVPARPGSSTRAGCNDVSGSPRTEVMHGDPVNTATGAYTECFTDAELPAPGVPFSVKRTYSSDITAAGGLGKGWVLPWESRLEIKSDGDVVLHAEGGSEHPYAKQSGGTFTAPAWARSKLAANDSGYKLTTPDLRTLDFDSTGRLTSVKDRAGQGLTLTYSGAQPTSIKDAAGRTATLSYAGSLLSKITLADGRYVDYGYTGSLLTSVTALDGGVETYGYDASGRLDKVTDSLGHIRATNVYDADGRVTSQSDAFGKVTQFKYSQAGAYKETDTVAPDGGVWTELYGGNVLVQQLDPFGNVTRYGYDSQFNRTSVRDALGRYHLWGYDTAGRLTSSEGKEASESWSYDAAGNVSRYVDGNYNITTFGYDSRNLLTSVKDPLGNTSTYSYTAAGLLETATSARGKTTAYGYDAAGNQISVTTPAGSKTTRTFDDSGRVLTVTDPRGNVTGADPAKFTTTFTYDAADRVASVKDARSNTTAYGYDAVGNLTKVTDAANRVTAYTFDAASRLTQVTDPAGKTAATGYDAVGRVSSVTDRTGAKTTYSYDKAGRQIEMVTARGNVTGGTPANHTWKIGYDKVGNRVTVTNPLGKTSAFAYDTENRPASTTDPLGHIRKVTYDHKGNVTSTIDALNHGSSLVYDANSRLISSATNYGYKTTYEYDADGNLTAEVSPLGERTTHAYDDDGRRSKTVDPRGNVTGAAPADHTWTYGYDAVGHPTSVTDPLGNQRKSAYDAVGNRTSATDALGKNTAYTYDALNRVSKVTGPDGGITANSYDVAGNLATSTDANSHTSTYGYDSEGRLTSIKDPLGKTVAYGYDADGNRTKVTNARGQTVTTTVDARNLITKVAYSDGTPSATYTYDAASRITGATDATGSRTLTYDNDDKLLSITSPGLTSPFAYTYNSDDTLSKRHYPDGRATSYAYDKAGRITGQTTNSKTVTYGYDATGHLTSTKLPTTTARSETRTYDRAGRLASMATPSGTNSYTYDAEGRVVTDKPASGYPTRYAYDAAGRTTRACTDTSATSCLPGTTGGTYAYDKVGNLTTSQTSSATTTYTYDAADQLTKTVAGSATTSFTYDADGNQTKDGADTYTYDPVGRVKSATIGADSFTFLYDADGNRTVANKNGALTRTSRWDINNPLPQIATDTNGSGALIADYHVDPSGAARSMDRTNGSFYFTHDRQESVSTVFDGAGTDNYRYTYSAWGVPTGKATSSGGQSSIYGYTGQYKDQYLPDRLLLRARSYDPGQRHFTTRDPIPAALGSPNHSAYAYAGNDPVNRSDPSGACPLCISAAIGGVVGGVIGGSVYAFTHQDDFDWGDFAAATGKGAVVGAGAGLLAPAGGGAAAALGLQGGRALATSGLVNAGVGAGYTWAVNTAQCQPTTPGDLLFGALGGGLGTMAGPAWNGLKGLFAPRIVVSAHAAQGPRLAYRALREGEVPTFGIHRPGGNPNVQPWQHVVQANDSPWISLTFDPSVAINRYGGSANGVIAVDINRVRSETADVAAHLEIPNDPYHMFDFAKDNALRDREFLVKFGIDPDAILKHWGPGVTLDDILRDVDNGL
ncbi:DUF6531 domain-containing protein [Streptomyces sp. 7N604]|uniref:DUF6531 domain-containing protein n=1 Tax=Streptomyces sp. 7N604 TaxID=3457415 RepID=UPI003FD526A4